MSYRPVSSRGEPRSVRTGRIAPVERSPDVEFAHAAPRLGGRLSAGPNRSAAEAASRGSTVSTSDYGRRFGGRIGAGRTPEEAAEALERGIAGDPGTESPRASRFVNEGYTNSMPMTRDRAARGRRRS